MNTASKLLAEQYQSVLEEIKPAVSETVFERLNESIRRNQELLGRLQRENKLLREPRRLELLEKYGLAAETLCDEQLELLELEPGVSSSEVEAESQRTQLSLPLKSAPARKHPGRQPLPAELPREEQIIACHGPKMVVFTASAQSKERRKPRYRTYFPFRQSHAADERRKLQCRQLH